MPVFVSGGPAASNPSRTQKLLLVELLGPDVRPLVSRILSAKECVDWVAVKELIAISQKPRCLVYVRTMVA